MEEKAALASAREDGKKDGRIETATKLLKLKIPIEQIMEATELTKEQIEEIRNKNIS